MPTTDTPSTTGGGPTTQAGKSLYWGAKSLVRGEAAPGAGPYFSMTLVGLLDGILAIEAEARASSPPPLTEIERLVDHWQAEADRIMAVSLSDPSQNTGMAAARSTALSEVVVFLRPILARLSDSDMRTGHD